MEGDTAQPDTQPQADEAAFFPFRGEGPEVRLRLNMALKGVERLVHQIVKRRLRRATGTHHQWHDADDLAAEALVHISRYTLPKFDTRRGCKPSTLIHHAAHSFVSGAIRHMTGARRKTTRAQIVPFSGSPVESDQGFGATLKAASSFHDRRIEAIADAIRANPERYFTEHQTKVFRELMAAGPTVTMRQLARRFGLRHAGSLSETLARMRERVADISIEDFDASRPAGGPLDRTNN